jgi:hypothetical protein
MNNPASAITVSLSERPRLRGISAGCTGIGFALLLGVRQSFTRADRWAVFAIGIATLALVGTLQWLTGGIIN